MLLLNISTDNIYIQIKDEIINLDRHEIEDIIGPTLVKLYKKYNFTKVLLINGPGGFTNLRVGTLALNLLNSLENEAIDIYSITKVDLFKYFVDKQELPNKGIIYIGQKKNIWLYDFLKGDYDTIQKPDIDYDLNMFFDLVYDEQYFNTQTNPKITSKKINIYLENEKIILTYNNIKLSTNIDSLKIKAEKMTEPKYFIEPIMGKNANKSKK